MSAKGILLLCTLVIASSLVHTAENTSPLLGSGLNTSFRIDAPQGWSVLWRDSGKPKTENGQIQAHVFDLVPTSLREDNSSPPKSSLRGFIYTNMVPTAAIVRTHMLVSGRLNEFRIDGLPWWTIVEVSGGRMLTAYRPLDGDVFYISLLSVNDELYAQGKSDLLNMLKSYREEGAGSP